MANVGESPELDGLIDWTPTSEAYRSSRYAGPTTRPDVIVPEARGKAAAVSTYLAGGGGMSKGGRGKPGWRYSEGRLRGKTQDQAVMEAGRMWDSAPDNLREKYARLDSSAQLAPSEVPTLGMGRPFTPAAGGPRISAATSSNVSGAAPSARSFDSDRSGIPDTIQRNAPAVASAPVSSADRVATYAGPKPTASDAKFSPLAQGEIAKRRGAATAAPTGAPVLTTADAASAAGATGTTINRLTGLPFGFRPGDALPSSADPAMQDRGAQSVKRQEIATSQAQPVQGKPITGALSASSITPAQDAAARNSRMTEGGSVEGDRAAFALNTRFRQQEEERRNAQTRSAERAGLMQAGRLTDGRGKVVPFPL